MSAEKIIESLTPVAAKLALEALEAILQKDPRRAARRAEEAARREILKERMDSELAAKARLKKRSEAARAARVIEAKPAEKKGKKGKKKPEATEPSDENQSTEETSVTTEE